jgi:hypothetical protein
MIKTWYNEVIEEIWVPKHKLLDTTVIKKQQINIEIILTLNPSE